MSLSYFVVPESAGCFLCQAHMPQKFKFLFMQVGISLIHCGFVEGCHAPLPKIRGNGVATRVGDVYTRGQYPTYTR